MSFNVIKWIMYFLNGRSPPTKVNGVCSLSLDITRSIVQGSGVGPFVFITCVNDYKTLGRDNRVLKYADKFSLLVTKNSNVSAASETAHIISWSESNKLEINLAKCRELVFKRPNLKQEISLCTLPDVVHVNTVKLLGVYPICAFKNTWNKLQETVTSNFTCCSNCINKDLAMIV